MSQTTVAEPKKALEGLLYDLGNTDITSFSAEIAVPFGKYVNLGTDKERQVLLPLLTTDVTNEKLAGGFSVRTQEVENPMPNSADPVGTYAIGESVSVIKKGRIWVLCEDDFDQSDDVFVRFADGTETNNNGGVRTDADTATAVALPNARFLNSGLAGELALLDLSIL